MWKRRQGTGTLSTVHFEHQRRDIPTKKKGSDFSSALHPRYASVRLIQYDSSKTAPMYENEFLSRNFAPSANTLYSAKFARRVMARRDIEEVVAVSSLDAAYLNFCGGGDGA
jgi:hypothetical protein